MRSYHRNVTLRGEKTRRTFPTETANPELTLEMPRARKPLLDPTNPLHQALMRLGMLLESGKGAAPNGAATCSTSAAS